MKKTITLKSLLWIVGAVVVVAAGAIIVAVNFHTWFPSETSGGEKSGFSADVDESAGNWNGNVGKSDGAEAGIQIPGYPSITIAKDTQDVSITLLNPEGNPCYFQFEIVLADTGESLYTSKLVPPGQAITSETLSRALSAGEYNATIKVTTTSLTDGSAINGANVDTVLIAK